MDRSFFFAKEIMTYRFANGHKRSQDGTIEITRPWDMGRYGGPMGGMSSNLGDQLAWARFHMGDGTAPDGTRLLSEEMLRRMQEPTVQEPGERARRRRRDRLAAARPGRLQGRWHTVATRPASTRSSRWCPSGGSRSRA